MTLSINTLLSYQTEIFEINKANGFWDMGVENRSFGQHIALVHSEVSEALEADRKDLNDDKLPEYKGVHVELADVVIRILDWNGANKNPYIVSDTIREVVASSPKYNDYTNFSEFAAIIHALLSDWYTSMYDDFSFIILEKIVEFIDKENVDFIEIIEKKLAVNRARGYKHGNKNY